MQSVDIKEIPILSTEFHKFPNINFHKKMFRHKPADISEHADKFYKACSRFSPIYERTQTISTLPATLSLFILNFQTWLQIKHSDTCWNPSIRILLLLIMKTPSMHYSAFIVLNQQSLLDTRYMDFKSLRRENCFDRTERDWQNLELVLPYSTVLLC